MPGKRPGINPFNPRDITGLEIIRQASFRPPIAWIGLVFLHEQCPNLNPVGFDILVIDSIIADQGIGHGHHLTAVGRISQYLLITGHARVENHFPDRFSMPGKGSTRKYGPVF